VPVAFLLFALTAPQPDLRFVGHIYKPDWLLLSSFVSSVVIWLLWRIIAPPVPKLYYVSLAIGVISGAGFLFFAYFSGMFLFRT